MSVQVTMLQTRLGEDGNLWLAGETKTATDAFARLLVSSNLATATFQEVPQSSLTAAQVEGLNAGNLVDAAGGVLALSEVVEEVLANPSATTQILTGAGEYFAYRCTVAAGNITIYDNTASSGKVLVPTTALVVGSYPIFGAGVSKSLAVDTGIRVVLSGAATVYIAHLGS